MEQVWTIKELIDPEILVPKRKITVSVDHRSSPEKFCSICGEEASKAGVMAEVRDRGNNRDLIRICRDCARLVIQAIDEEANRGEPPATNT
jgi:hypothetical protein